MIVLLINVFDVVSRSYRETATYCHVTAAHMQEREKEKEREGRERERENGRENG